MLQSIGAVVAFIAVASVLCDIVSRLRKAERERAVILATLAALQEQMRYVVGSKAIGLTEAQQDALDRNVADQIEWQKNS